jgi:hypothetical protein
MEPLQVGFSLLESLLTGNDLIKRHPHSFPWKIWERAYAIESAHGVQEVAVMQSLQTEWI